MYGFNDPYDCVNSFCTSPQGLSEIRAYSQLGSPIFWTHFCRDGKSFLQDDRVCKVNFEDEENDFDFDFSSDFNEIEIVMAHFVPLVELLKAGPIKDNIDAYPCIALQDVEVRYEDGTLANLLAVDFKKYRVIITGRVSLEPEDMHFCKSTSIVAFPN